MIYYWNGAFTTQRELNNETINIAVQKLITSDYAPHDLEKLRGQSQSSSIIYSYRISAEARLLFTTYQRSLHVLEYLPHHKYNKSRFLRAGVLRNYLARVDVLQKSILFAPLDEDEQKPSFASESTNRSLKGLDYYNNQFISFSEEQESVLHQLQLPLILNGAAGTGKSYLGFGMIQHKLQESLNEAPRCLYITEETVLTSSMRENWENYFALDNTGEIQFKTYAELFSNEHCDLQIVGKDFFSKWFLALKSGSNIPSISVDACYQEFRICSGLSKDSYAALGMRQSSIEQGSAREIMYTLYLQYLTFLGTEHADLAFSSWSETSISTESNRYDFIMVDEAQRFSLLQNKTLARLARNHAIVYCMDSLQNLVDQYSSRVLLEVELRNVGVQTHTLDKAYRYTSNVAKALDQVLENNRLIMGKGDKQEANLMSTGKEVSPGEFHFITPEAAEHTDWLIERAEGVHLAVVTHERLVAEARRIFKTALVFTVAQIQGQEFHTVVVYKLLSDEDSKRTLKKITGQLASGNRSTGHRSKDKAAHLYSPWVHRIFTACSRAMDSLIIVDHLNGYWERLISNATNINPAPAIPTSHIERVAMMDKQANLGNAEIATLINQSLDSQPCIKTKLTSGHKKERSSKKTTHSSAVINIPSAPIFDEALGVRLLWLVSNTMTSKILNEIKLLINNPKTNLNQPNEHGGTVAMVMVLRNIEAILPLLLAQGKRVDWQLLDKEGFNALLFAAARKNVDMVKAILKQDLDMNLNHANYEGNTALMLAAEHGPTKMAEVLLEHHQRIKLNQTNNNGTTALIFAIQYNNIEIVRELVKLDDINLNQIEKGAISPLCIAIIFKHLDIIRLLLTQGERIDLLGLEPCNDAPLLKMLACAIACNNKSREILGVLFGDARVLKALIKYEIIFSSPDSYLAKNPLFIGMCIKQREHVWEILKSLKEGDLSCDEYHHMLKDISNARYAPDRFYALSQILFKQIPTNHFHSSPGNEQSLKIRKELENEISVKRNMTIIGVGNECFSVS